MYLPRLAHKIWKTSFQSHLAACELIPSTKSGNIRRCRWLVGWVQGDRENTESINTKIIIICCSRLKQPVFLFNISPGYGTTPNPSTIHTTMPSSTPKGKEEVTTKKNQSTGRTEATSTTAQRKTRCNLPNLSQVLKLDRSSIKFIAIPKDSASNTTAEVQMVPTVEVLGQLIHYQSSFWRHNLVLHCEGRIISLEKISTSGIISQ